MTTEYSGSGDPARSLELLWGTRQQTRRGPRPRLTVEQITQTAIRLADAEGLPALSMRRLADRLGVSAMSLYTYVPGKAELIDVMLDTVTGEIPLPDRLPGGWRARIERWARETLACHRRHPWMVHVATGHPPMGPHEVELGESTLATLSGIGLTDREIFATMTVVDGYVRGVARKAVDALQVVRDTGVTDEQWYTSHAPLLDSLITPDRYPTMTRFHHAGVFEDPMDDFEFGLQRLLDGLETLLRSRAASRPASARG